MSKRARILLIVGVSIAVLAMLASLVSRLLVDYWWYQETGYTSVFWTSWRTRALLYAIFGVTAAVVIGLNAYLAYRFRPAFRPMTVEQQNLDQYRRALEPRGKLVLFTLVIATFLFAGYAAQAQWQSYLLWANSTPFGTNDPQFGLDVSFYTFELPFYRFVLTFLIVVVVLSALIAAGVHYLYGGIRLNTPGQRFSTAALTHLSVLLGVFVLMKAGGYWLDRYDLMFSNRGERFYGAAAADVNAMLPAKSILVFVALICAIAFFANLFIKNFAIPAMSLALLVLASFAIGTAYPAIYDRLVVKPNANVEEAEYINRAMEATRVAYGIGPDNVEYVEYPAASTAPASEIRADTGTIPHLRLLDPNVISDVVQQDQQVRNIYSFPQKLDIDRYTIDGQTEEYVVAVRELDPSKFTEDQANWINSHTVYTHGYGLVAAPANEVNQAGMPNFVNADFDEGLIAVDQPRIYYGELNDDYSIVGKPEGAPDKEFDRPTGAEEDVKVTYDGAGGVPVDTFARKLVFAINYAETNFLLNSGVGENSKIIYNRTPRERVELAAPFLTPDGDPYPAVIDGKIVWIVDAYTTSSGYPYAAQEVLGEASADAQTGAGTAALPDETINYIRNSVKATVDAYDGTVTLYTWDEDDPVLKTWKNAYPGLILDKSEIPEAINDHLRYPEDLFKIQRSLIAQYHVTSPGQFYSQDGFWRVAGDPNGGEGDQPAYYVRSQLPGENQSTFKLTSALTAQSKENLTAYVSAQSDPEDYGKITVLTMPPQSNIQGPAQVQSAFKSDDQVKESIKLLSGEGSRIIWGNLLTVPIAGGLLYVEPMYVEGSSQAAFPTLQKVLLQYGDKIAFADTISEGLDQMFGEGAGDLAQNTPNLEADTPDTPPVEGQPPAAGAPSAEVLAANTELQNAIAEYDAAAQSGDYAGMGAAQQKIVDAAKKLDGLMSASAASPADTGTPDNGTPDNGGD